MGLPLSATYRPPVSSYLTGWHASLDDWAAGGLDAAGVEWWLTDAPGWRDRPAPRNSGTDRPQDHGQFDAPSYLQARIITLEGTAVAPTAEAQYLAADIISSVCADPAVLYPLVVTEPGRPARRCMVRLNDATKVSAPYGDGTVFDWNVQLKAPDPRRYADDLTSVPLSLPASSGVGITLPVTLPFPIPTSGSSTGTATVVNAGTLATPPVVTFVGPLIDPRVANITTGRTLGLTITLDAGQTLIVDMAARTVLLGGTVSRAYTITPGSAWWDLPPGSSDLVLTGGGGAGTATVTFRSAWH